MKRARSENVGNKDSARLSGSVASATDDASTHTDTKADVYAPRGNSDGGHRYGNFHNYYTFNLVSNRTQYLGEILTGIASQWTSFSHTGQSFRYTDIGCNEGDLTLRIAKMLADHLSNPLQPSSPKATNGKNVTATDRLQQSEMKLLCTGLDLDADLIQRAQLKIQKDTELQLKIRAAFKVVDVLNDDIAPQSDGGETASGIYYSDLTTLFSTTMWIHIHGGDDGLRRVIKQVCSCTRYWILLEPQPSKCYAKVAFRLRRLGLHPIDVSNERLRLRSNIEEQIESMMNEFQFERVLSKSMNDGAVVEHARHKDDGAETRTQWNRTLRLYKRVSIPM